MNLPAPKTHRNERTHILAFASTKPTLFTTGGTFTVGYAHRERLNNALSAAFIAGSMNSEYTFKYEMKVVTINHNVYTVKVTALHSEQMYFLSKVLSMCFEIVKG